MTTFDYTLIFLGLFILGLAWISSTSRHLNKNDGFIIGSRELGFWSVFSTMISFFYAGDMFYLWFTFVAMIGFGTIWICTAIAAPVVAMAVAAPTANRLAKENDYITFPDLIKDRQGPLMEQWVIYGSLYGAAALTTAQLFVAGSIVGGLLEIDTISGTLFSATIVALYVIQGGFKSVVRTDIYQAATMIILIVCASAHGEWPERAVILEQLTSPSVSLVTGFVVFGLCNPVNTDLWQRFFAVKNPSTARNATLAAFFVNQCLLMLGVILFISTILAMRPSSTDPEQVFEELFSNGTANPLVVSLFGLYIVSAILSTLDNQVFNFTSIAVKNILKTDHVQHHGRYVFHIRFIALFMLIILTILSFTIENLMQWIITGYGILGVLCPFIFYAVYHKCTNSYSDKILSIGVLSGVVLYWVVFYLVSYDNPLWYAVPNSVPIFFILTDYLLKNKLCISTLSG